MGWADKIARWLSPELDRQSRQLWWLRSQVADLQRWCDGEAATVAQWLGETYHDHWRALGDPATGKLPHRIDEFREQLRRQRNNVQE